MAYSNDFSRQHHEHLVVLVDCNDKKIGTIDKLDAHRRGLLHRAFSVIVIDNKGRLLLQKRAAAKYHSGGLWTNSCCGHPRPGEAVPVAARRRLREEMGINILLAPLFRTCYCTEVSNGLIENEFVYVLAGQFDGCPTPDPSEAEDWRWATLEEISDDVAWRPELYSIWFAKYVTEFQNTLVRRIAQHARG